MIDPKFNEIPADRDATRTSAGTATPTEAEEAERLRVPRQGLSIRDTIAGDSMLSVGARGVDVSGVEAGSGAGAGSTSLTPGLTSSPAPEVVSGARATGTTPRGSSASGQSPAANSRFDAGAPGISGEGDANTAAATLSESVSPGTGGSSSGEIDPFADREVADRAYECWCERGKPHGSPEVDWHRAVTDVRERRRSQSSAPKASAASA